MQESDENGKINNALHHKTKMLEEETTWLKQKLNEGAELFKDKEDVMIFLNESLNGIGECSKSSVPSETS